jgi:thymidylate synthase (FAD)
MDSQFPTSSPDRFRELVNRRAAFTLHTEGGTSQGLHLGNGIGRVMLIRRDSVEHAAVVARKSYTPAGKLAVPRKKEQNLRLARSLVLDNHSGPLNFVNFEFEFECPKFVFDHLVRYNMAKKSVSSGRYANIPRKAYAVPQAVVDVCWDHYETQLASGVDKELARACLPVGQMVQFQFQLDLRCFINLLSQRLDPAAQDETRAFAWAMARLVQLAEPEAMHVIGMELIWSWARQEALGGKRPRPTIPWVEDLHLLGPSAVLGTSADEHMHPAIPFLRAGVLAQDDLTRSLFALPDLTL